MRRPCCDGLGFELAPSDEAAGALARALLPERAEVMAMHPKDSSVPPTTEPCEGEGSYTAARRYDEATRKFIESGRVPEAAQRAKEALDAAEGEELRRAEQEGKRQASGVELDKVIPERDIDVDVDADEVDADEEVRTGIEEGDLDLDEP